MAGQNSLDFRLRQRELGKVIHQDTMPSAALGISRYVLDERLRQRLEEHGGMVETGVRARPDDRRLWLTAFGAGFAAHGCELWRTT